MPTIKATIKSKAVSAKTAPSETVSTAETRRGKTSPTHRDALAFALADCRWRRLSADGRNRQEPDGKRALAAAFLESHAARLALEAGEALEAVHGGAQVFTASGASRLAA